MVGLKVSAQWWGFITYQIGACSVLAIILIGTGIPSPHQKSIQVRAAVPISDRFCMDRLDWLCGYTIQTTAVPTLIYLFIYFVYLGGEPHHSFLCLGAIPSVYMSLCVCFHFILFSPCILFSSLFFPDLLFLFSLSLLCLCFFLHIFFFFFFLFHVLCRLSIYFSYIFALERPPKVALPSYSLPGLPWNETIFSLCSEVCGSNTLPFAHLVGWEPLCA